MRRVTGVPPAPITTNKWSGVNKVAGLALPGTLAGVLTLSDFGTLLLLKRIWSRLIGRHPAQAVIYLLLNRRFLIFFFFFITHE